MPIIEKLYNGAWLVSDIVNGYRVKRQYFAYSKREAITEFKAEMAQNKHSGGSND